MLFEHTCRNFLEFLLLFGRDTSSRPFNHPFFAKMMMPFMQKPPPKEYIGPKWRAIGRAALFVTSVVVFIKFGDQLDFPENPKNP